MESGNSKRRIRCLRNKFYTHGDRRSSTSVSVMEFEDGVITGEEKRRDAYMYVTVMGMVITLFLLVLFFVFFLYRDDCFWRCIQVINSTKDTNNKNNNNEKYLK